MSDCESAVIFPCGADRLIGIVTTPSQPARRGVVIVVGGPQYRAGSHRQFTLLARQLAAAGIPSFRFDYRGMGDSEGEWRDFEHISADLGAAIDAFFAHSPGLGEIAIWGLCDAASAALFYAPGDARVSGLVLLNPWVHTVAGTAKTYLKHYYVRRLIDPDFWRKLARGKFSARAAAASFYTLVKQTRAQPAAEPHAASTSVTQTDLPQRMLRQWQSFNGRILLILSGNDFTAREFVDLSQSSRTWKKCLAARKVTRHDIVEANHTFSTRQWREEVAHHTIQWLKQ